MLCELHLRLHLKIMFSMSLCSSIAITLAVCAATCGLAAAGRTLAGGCACANGLAVDEGAGDGVLKLRWAGRADLQIDGIVDLCLLHG